MGREDWGRSWKPWLRGTAIGFPFGAIPAGGAETPTFLSYVLERRLTQERRRVRQGRHRGRRRAGGRQQRLGRRHVRPAARARAAGHRDRDDHAGGAAGLRHPARPAADDRPARPGVDAARQPADRQPLLLVLNLPLAPLWAKLLQIPRPYLYAGILFFASLGRLRRQPARRSTCSCSWSSACSGWRCAASASRCCR